MAFCTNFGIVCRSQCKLRSLLRNNAGQCVSRQKEKTMTLADELVRLSGQHNEILKRVNGGTLEPESVRRALQDIITGKFAPPVVSSHPTGWYITPTDQVARMADLIHSHPGWGFTTADIPVVPDDFAPATSTEVLLLVAELPKKGKLGSVQRTFDEAWSLIQTPADHQPNWRWPDLRSDAKHLRLVPGKQPKPGLRWVGFDPFANWEPQNGRRVKDLWQHEDIAATLAASEALWAAVMFPDLVADMDGQKIPHFDLAGYQFNWDGADEAWTHCPCLHRWAGGRQVELHAHWADFLNVDWAAPSVREL